MSGATAAVSVTHIRREKLIEFKATLPHRHQWLPEHPLFDIIDVGTVQSVVLFTFFFLVDHAPG